MPSETAARAGPLSDSPNERDYQAFCEALSANARGRAFLAEYARRNRNSDTEQLLTAVDRLQSFISANPVTQTAGAVKYELRALLDEISTAQSELEASVLAIKATKLAELTSLIEQRISKILDSLHAEAMPEPEASSQTSAPPHLAVVPSPEQPELPIPSPSALLPPSIALVRSESIMAEVAFVVPPEPQDPGEKTASEAVNMPGSELQQAASVAERPPSKPVPSTTDPLASITALSEEERLALFT
jgi:hypothetical protein